MPFSATACDSKGKALAGEATATFLVYEEQQGGEPLYTESQTVIFDEAGHFRVQFGAANRGCLFSFSSPACLMR